MAATMSTRNKGHHQRNRRAAAIAITVAVALVVIVTEADSAAVADTTGDVPIITELPTVTAPAPAAPPAQPAPAPLAPIPETTVPPASPVLVPNPRSGDLRTDPSADALPDSYEPAPAASAKLDVPYGEHGAQRIDLHLPHQSASGEAPVVVYLHAGGWVGGHEDDIPAFVTRFVERGFAVASVGYRLAPQHPFPAAVHDVKHAIRWLKAYSDREGLIDGERMVLVGTSAGGHLAAFAGATVGAFEPDVGPDLAGYDSSVAAVVSAVGPTDLSSFYSSGEFAAALTEAFVGCSPCTVGELEEASPTRHLHGDLPPAYWAYGSDDALVDAAGQGAAMADAWAAASPTAPSWLDVVDGQGHNLDETTINQRHLEVFVDLVLGRDPLDLP